MMLNYTLTAQKPGEDAATEQVTAAELHEPAVSAVVFHDEPALKTLPEDGDVLPYQVADQDVSYQCSMRHDGEPTHGFVGWVEREHADTYGRDLIDLEWVPFYEIRLPGDSATTRFCEDCMGWLIEAADHIRTS